MKKQGIYTVIKNERIAKSTFELVLEGDTSPFTRRGSLPTSRLTAFFLQAPVRLRLG
jgi:hypothetical protein